MSKLPDLVIDIGHQNIKILKIHVGKKGGIRVVKAGVEPLIIAEGDSENTQYQRVQETLPLLLQRLGIKGKRAIVSLPGRSAFTRRLKVPVVRGRQLRRIIQYEARQHIPFPLDQVNMDYQITATQGEAGELDINLVAVRREIADAYAKALKKCGIRSDIIEVAPLSIYNAYAASIHYNPEEVTAIVSMGATSTDIVIEQNGTMQFMRSAPVAGNTLTTLLVKNLDVTPEKAEELKKKSSSEYGEGESEISAERVSALLEKGFDQIVTEVRRSFDFYVSQPDALPVTRVFLSGGTVRMEGVSEFLEDRLGVPVQLLDATENEGFSCPDENKDMLKYEAALVGMAARCAGRAACGMSFSPDPIKQRLELERRAPMFGVMAVLVAVMIGGSVYLLDQLLATKANAVEQVSGIVNPSQRFNKELADIRGTQDKFRDRFTRINEIAEKRGFLTRIYLEVQSLVPQDIWLESVDETSRKLTIEGRSLDVEKISSYIQHLKMSPFFKSEAVALTNFSPVSDVTTAGPVQLQFTITISDFNTPTDEEIRFVDEFRKLSKEGEILLIQFEHATPDNPMSDTTLIVGVYQQSDQDKVNLIRKMYSCLEKAKDETIKFIDLRFHDKESNLVENIKLSRDLVKAFYEKTKSQDELIQGFERITPLPSPTPSPTPTPEKEEGDTSAQTGAYGGMGMYGGMGVPGAAAAAPAAGAAAGGGQ